MSLRTALVLVALAAGCSQKMPEPPVSSAEPIGLQMLRTEAQLSKYPFFTLLSFERETDPVFVRVEGPNARLDATRSHTGSQSLVVPAGARNMTVKLAALHSGRDWPADWTLVGAYFYSVQPQRLAISYEADRATLATYNIELPAGQWTPVIIDIAAAMEGRRTSDAGSLRIVFPSALAQPTWIDDVVEVNNNSTLVETSTPAGRWLVQEYGFRYIVERKSAFGPIVLKTPEAPGGGWRLEEANSIRARFTSRGKSARVIYASGREYVDGKFHALDPRGADALAAQDASPARITVGSDFGRVSRNSSGDENNDGYSEATGAYQIIATGPRLELQIQPQTPSLVDAVLEISGLPAGKILASMDGKLVDRIERLEDGRVLIELSGLIEKPVSLSVRVTADQSAP